MYKLTVIIPAYNAENNLNRCIDSILNQDIEDVEILLVNDGSNDNTCEVAKQYGDKITYYKKENTGVADTRNFGINFAQGKYIMFVDSDDYIEEGLLANIKTYIEQDIDIIKYKAQYERDSVVIKIDGPTFDLLDGKTAFNKLAFLDNLMDSPCLYAFKKELFTNNNMFFKTGTEHEDFGLIPLIILLAKTVVSTDIYGYYYVQTDNSITRNDEYSKNLKRFEDTLLHYDNMLEFIGKIDLDKITKRNLKIYYTNSVLLRLKLVNKSDRKPYIRQIKQRKMINNIKIKNMKQLIKRIILTISINLYLKVVN